MCLSLTDQVRSIASVTTAVAEGDLTRKIEIEVEGEMHQLKATVNAMVDDLNSFASEVTRVALEVGTQGILGGQAKVEGVKGTWADLTLNVNKMAANLTDQVRSISKVTKAVAMGDLAKIVDVNVQGEMLELKETVNQMVSQLRVFANEVTRVSLEVGTEGRLGGQAVVPGVDGTWRVSFPLYLVVNSVNGKPGIDGQCQFDGHEPDKPSAVNCRGHQSRRERRLDQESRDRCQGRVPRVEGDGQPDDRVVERFCRRGDASG